MAVLWIIWRRINQQIVAGGEEEALPAEFLPLAIARAARPVAVAAEDVAAADRGARIPEGIFFAVAAAFVERLPCNRTRLRWQWKMSRSKRWGIKVQTVLRQVRKCRFCTGLKLKLVLGTYLPKVRRYIQHSGASKPP